MKKTYIISEIGLNHNGSIKLAKEMGKDIGKKLAKSTILLEIGYYP